MNTKKALVIIDVQNDFCPQGALAVPEGDKIIPALNQYIEIFKKHKYLITASRDWHPANSEHFKQQGGPWPNHCIRDTKGANFHSLLKLPANTMVVSKGLKINEDGYSVFEAQDNSGIPFDTLLKKLNISTLYVGGLATEYCVKASVLSALQHYYQVYLLIDAIRGIDSKESASAIAQMCKQGAKKLTIDLLNGNLSEG